MKSRILLFLVLVFVSAVLAPEYADNASSGTNEPQPGSSGLKGSQPERSTTQEPQPGSITTKESPPESITTYYSRPKYKSTRVPRLELKIFRFLNGSLANPVFDAVMPFITDLRRWRVVFVLVWSALVILGGSRGRWAALMLIPLVAASDQISSHLIKPIVGRIRPCEILGNVHLWHGLEGWITTPAEVVRSYKSSFSFPSSHAANITSSMLFLGLASRKLLIPLLVIAVLVSFSRIYIGVHWGSDAAAGMIIGAALALPAYIIFKRISGKNAGGVSGEE